MLSRYGQLGASSRVRFFQYLPWLEAAGIRTTISPLFSDAYVQGLQQDRKPLIEALGGYARRLRVLLASRRFDLLWIEKESLPWLPAWFEKRMSSDNVPYVLDYDDAVFHYYDGHRSRVVRALLSGKHRALIQGAALVVAGNEYLAEFARRQEGRHVTLLPTVVDLDRYLSTAPNITGPDGPPCVGWIGQRATASFLAPWASLFERLNKEGLARFSAIGIDAKALGLPMESLSWTEQSEAASIASFDIGIMPLVDGPFERGKCGYKLIQYMACGLPVVASPVGVNRQIVEHGVNGFLAETLDEWEHALRLLLDDPGLRARMGQAGRRKVEQQYSLQVTGPRMASLLHGALA